MNTINCFHYLLSQPPHTHRHLNFDKCDERLRLIHSYHCTEYIFTAIPLEPLMTPNPDGFQSINTMKSMGYNSTSVPRI
ncbi:hypothetical protein M378DRAFT_618050 [Amanita muscaria Koide BX008]|uniref:Uncharacterized protein n=1 Tax=Amanita muscaria (strain Koide BX008) TaxID=946122 RepID=A0A0C2XMG7_AMAMK|nr:hypothetical protein M378DRAFT_618050 [Amanita muscaria Koide BX008]